MVKDFNSSWLDGEPIALRLPRAAACFANHAIKIVVTRLDVGPEAVRASATLLSDAERQRAGRFAFDRDRRRDASESRYKLFGSPLCSASFSGGTQPR